MKTVKSDLFIFEYTENQFLFYRVGILTALTMKTAVPWKVVQCCMVEVYLHFGGMCCPYLQGRRRCQHAPMR
jgi:hypothetical protein